MLSFSGAREQQIVDDYVRLTGQNRSKVVLPLKMREGGFLAGLAVIPFGFSGMRVEDRKRQRAVPRLSLQQARPLTDRLPHFAWTTP
jgi:hypothetical protein